MKKILLTLLLLLSACDIINPPTPEPPAVVRTPPVKGYDVLAVAKYCDTLLNAPPLPAISTVLEIFGDPMPCIEQYIKKYPNIVTDVQIDLVDATCHRNRVCPPGTPPLNDMNVMRQRAERMANYRNVYPNINWTLSPYLEHDIKSQVELQRAFDAVKLGCPKCNLINSPVSGTSIPGIPDERHGTKVSAFSVSGDGASSFDGDNIKNDGNSFQHRLSGSDTTFFWWNELNLRCTGEDKFVPIVSRTARPTSDQFLQAHKVITTEEPAKPAFPSGCRTSRDIEGSKGEITKTNAEAYCNGVSEDGRGNRLLLILLNKHGSWREKMSILKSDGTKVGELAYYGKYSDKRFGRWYIGIGSKENPYELYTKVGNEWAFAKDKNNNCIRFNIIRRQGVYR